MLSVALKCVHVANRSRAVMVRGVAQGAVPLYMLAAATGGKFGLNQGEGGCVRGATYGCVFRCVE